MSYSDQSSGGGSAAGVAGVFGTILLVCLGVGLNVAARAARNSSRGSWGQSETPVDPFYSREGARQTSIVPRSSVSPDWQAEQERLERERVEADARRQAEWQQQQEANRLAQAQQAEADRQRRETQLQQQQVTQAAQRQAEQDQRDRDRAAQIAAQEQRDRDLAAQQAARNPAPAQAAMQPGGPAANPDVPPGFAVTAVQQVKPKDTVFVRAQDGWFPAVILHRRGAAVTIRYTANGIVDQVTLNRIRLQTEPGNTVEADDARPAALRPVAGGRDPANKGEPEDDALIVARPRKEEPPAEEQAFAAAPNASAPIAKGPPPMFRTWSNDTGEFKVEAELVGFEFDVVQLKKKDGKVASVRIEILSAEDQAFVRDRYK